MNFWVLPKNINKILNKSEAIDVLVTGTNEIPLWIGVKVKGNVLELIISKRFKKLKVINNWHKGSENAPFIGFENLKPVPNPKVAKRRENDRSIL